MVLWKIISINFLTFHGTQSGKYTSIVGMEMLLTAKVTRLLPDGQTLRRYNDI